YHSLDRRVLYPLSYVPAAPRLDCSAGRRKARSPPWRANLPASRRPVLQGAQLADSANGEPERARRRPGDLAVLLVERRQRGLRACALPAVPLEPLVRRHEDEDAKALADQAVHDVEQPGQPLPGAGLGVHRQELAGVLEDQQ